MKRLTSALILLTLIGLSLQAQGDGNPFRRLGYHTPVYTFGEDKEFHDQQVIVEINSVLFNTKTNEVVGFIEDKDSLAELSPELQSMSIDPLCEKYYSVSPYAYCFNNPVKFVDPTGMWIEYYDGTDTYRYMNGQWNQYQRSGKNIGQFTPYTAAEGSFLAGVLSGLNMLSQNKVGKGLLDFFANDDNNASFIIADEGSQANVYDSAKGDIYLDGKFNGSEIPTENGNQTSPFWLDIGHELAHRQDVINNGAAQASATWLRNQDKIFTESEKYATHMENLMRANAGLPLRTHYGTQGNGGWEPSRILRAGTRISLYIKVPVVIGNRVYPGVPVMY